MNRNIYNIETNNFIIFAKLFMSDGKLKDFVKLIIVSILAKYADS